MPGRPPHPRLLAYLEDYDPAVADLLLRLREIVLEQAPGAEEAIYRTNTISLWYGSSEELKDWFCYITAHAKHVNLGFVRGALLPGPRGLLQGSGKVMRYLPFASPEDLARPYLRHFLRAAMDLAGATGNGSGKTIIKPAQRG